jgi:hypothetical protein
MKTGKLPRELIEARSKTVGEFTGEHNRFPRQLMELNPYDMPMMLNIILAPDSVRLRVNNFPHIPFKLIKVYFRPAGFHLDIDQPRHLRSAMVT